MKKFIDISFLSIAWIVSILSILCFQETNDNFTLNCSFDQQNNAVPINEQQTFQNQIMISRGSTNAQRNISLGITKVLFTYPQPIFVSQLNKSNVC